MVPLDEIAHSNDGWFSVYIYSVSSRIPLDYDMTVNFVRTLVATDAGIMFVLSMLALLLVYVTGKKHVAGFYGILFLSVLFLGWVSRCKPGGYVNVMIPAYAVMAMLAGICIGKIADVVSKHMLQPAARAGIVFINLLLLVQMVSLAWPPQKSLYPDSSVAAYRDFVGKLAQDSGEIYLPWESYLAPMAGKKYHAHWSAVTEILWAKGDNPVKHALEEDIIAKLRRGYFSKIYCDDPQIISVLMSYGNNYNWSGGVGVPHL